MNFSISRAIRCLLLLLISGLLVSSCSSSSDSSLDEPQIAADPSGSNGESVISSDGTSVNANETEAVTADDTTSGIQNEANEASAELTTGSGEEPVGDQVLPDNNNPAVVDPLIQNVVLVSFDITVPAYSSNELRLEMVWGDLNLVADWIGDEFWSVSSELPTETEELLTVTYFDNQGAIELARFSQQFRTGSNPTEAFQVSADQFNTEQFDDDGDGVSNMDELIAGTDPFIDEDSLLPIEDSVLGSNYSSEFFESHITDERPLFITFQPSPNNPNQDSLSGNVDIDVDGNGTLIRNFKLGAKYDNKIGTRTHSENTVSWEGVVKGHDGSDYSYTKNFSNTITLIDESTRSYVEETTSASVGTYNFNSETRSNLIGRLIEGTNVCEPVAGTYFSTSTSNINGGRLSETSISKDITEPFWRVSRVFNSYYENNELVTTEYFARELSMDAGDGIEENGFICDSVDF